MDGSSLEALAYDPLKCSKLCVEHKRDLVYELSSWSDGATEILHAWSRQEILHILCAELGKERKYTGLTKSKMIEQLLKIVCEKKLREPSNVQTSLEFEERTSKRQRKPDFLDSLPSTGDTDSAETVYCKNSACRGKLNHNDVFCKRCSCCICMQYDDNKDPSLWLICSSDPPFRGISSCGMSCHLECALRHEKSGLSKDRRDKGLDGSFRCISCGKVNDLLGSWRKQLVVARDTRRVDILCYRLSLAQKILAGTKHYRSLFGVVDEAVENLEQEVGTLTGLPVKKARGIVNRLSSGPDIQKLCASAVESLDLILSKRPSPPSPDCDARVKFEDVQASSVTVVLNSEATNGETIAGYILWHRKADDANYPADPTCRLFAPNTKFLLSCLNPATKYFLNVLTVNRDGDTGLSEFQFRTTNSADEAESPNLKTLEIERSQSPGTNCSSLSNPSSVEDETNNIVPSTANICFGRSQTGPEPSTDTANLRSKAVGEEISTVQTGLECLPYKSEVGLQVTPSKAEGAREGKSGRKIGRKHADIGSEEPSKKRSKERVDEEQMGVGDKDFEYYVKVIRWLECDGHIETGFRQKFLTWYGLRATPQELRIVKVFVDTFIEDPESLAAQLVDAFSDLVSNKRCRVVPSGFCLKLWH